MAALTLLVLALAAAGAHGQSLRGQQVLDHLENTLQEELHVVDDMMSGAEGGLDTARFAAAGSGSGSTSTLEPIPDDLHAVLSAGLAVGGGGPCQGGIPGPFGAALKTWLVDRTYPGPGMPGGACDAAAICAWLTDLHTFKGTYTDAASLPEPMIIVGAGPTGLALFINMLVRFTAETKHGLVLAQDRPFSLMHIVTAQPRRFTGDGTTGMAQLLGGTGIDRLHGNCLGAMGAVSGTDYHLPHAVLSRYLWAVAAALKPDWAAMWMGEAVEPVYHKGYVAYLLPSKGATSTFPMVVDTTGGRRVTYGVVKQHVDTDISVGPSVLKERDGKPGLAVTDYDYGHFYAAFIMAGNNECDAVVAAVNNIAGAGGGTTSWDGMLSHAVDTNPTTATMQNVGASFAKKELPTHLCHVEVPIILPLAVTGLTHASSTTFGGFPLANMQNAAPGQPDTQLYGRGSESADGTDRKPYLQFNAVQALAGAPNFAGVSAPLAHTVLYELAHRSGAPSAAAWYNGKITRMAQMKFWRTHFNAIQYNVADAGTPSSLACSFTHKDQHILFLGDSCRDANPQLAMGTNDGAWLASALAEEILRDKDTRDYHTNVYADEQDVVHRILDKAQDDSYCFGTQLPTSTPANDLTAVMAGHGGPCYRMFYNTEHFTMVGGHDDYTQNNDNRDAYA